MWGACTDAALFAAMRASRSMASPKPAAKAFAELRERRQKPKFLWKVKPR